MNQARLTRAALGFAIAIGLVAPIGSPITGALSDVAGPRYALGLGAAACLAAAIIGRWPVLCGGRGGMLLCRFQAPGFGLGLGDGPGTARCGEAWAAWKWSRIRRA